MRPLPRDVKFYDQFLAQSRLAVNAVEILRRAAGAGGPAVSDAARELRELEREGGKLEREVFRRLHQRPLRRHRRPDEQRAGEE